MKPYPSLTLKQERALTALLTEVTVEAAAKKAGISDVTIWRWLQMPGFKAAYQNARRQIIADSVGLLQRASKLAVEALIRNLKCDHPAVEVSAARVILDQAYRGVEILELEERISYLEDALPEQPSTDRKF